MKYLADTHILLWFATDIAQLSKKITSILDDDESILYFSAASFWEISIKLSLGKLDLRGYRPEEFRQFLLEQTFRELAIDAELATSVYRLSVKDNHRDPIDRLLIWQAIQGHFALLSADHKFDQYKTDGLKLIH